MKTKQTFEESLRKSNLSENTISSYLWTIQYFEENYDGITKENLLAYKGYLMEYFKPKTVNLRIQARETISVRPSVQTKKCVWLLTCFI